MFLGNGLVAILAGLVANTLVTGMQLGPTAPFDAAATCLTVGGAIIALTWSENYGAAAKSRPQAAPAAADDEDEPCGKESSNGNSNNGGGGGGRAPSPASAFITALALQFRTAADAITSDPKVGLLGAMQSLFEASMYSFVFLWTPALSPRGEELPHGMIFATFMLSSMIGSSVASRLLTRADTRPELFMQRVFAVAAGALAVPVLVAASGIGAGPEWARAAAGSVAGVRAAACAFAATCPAFAAPRR